MVKIAYNAILITTLETNLSLDRKQNKSKE